MTKKKTASGFESLSEKFSLIPLNGKVPPEKNWTKWCTEKRPFKPADFKNKNAGIACGPASGVIVIDIDDSEKFKETRLFNGWEIPSTYTVQTGSGGYHLYFQYPDDGKEYRNRTCIERGFDVRGVGGQVVAPGSIHPDTKEAYKVVKPIPPAPSPQWLLDMAERKEKAHHSDATPRMAVFTLEDKVVLEKALASVNGEKIKRLYDGDHSGYPSQSEADQALCNHLAFWFQKDRQRMDAAFCSSGLMRDKWDREDYRNQTIEKALAATTETYDPQKGAGATETGAPAIPKDILNAINSNEDGDAKIYIQLHKDRFCYDHAEGQWYVFKDHFWSVDLIGESLAALNSVIDIYAKKAEKLSQERVKAVAAGDSEKATRSKKGADSILRRIRELQSLRRKRNVLYLSAVGKDSLGIDGKTWDSDPMRIGCLNGVIDLKTGKLGDGKPVDYIRTVVPTEYTGIDTPCPIWEKFLNDTFDNDLEIISYLQRLFGYAVTGNTTEHVYPIFWGQGRNGKGTVFETIRAILGDYSGPIDCEMILNNRQGGFSGGPKSDIIYLYGKRFVWASEISEGRSLNSGKVKWLTGGDTLTGRPPYGKHQISFTPTHTLFLLTNDKPQARANDYALWKRIHLIPFPFSFVDDPQADNERKADPDLIHKLQAESSGMLAWLVKGCLLWQADGLNPPRSVKAATEEYRQNEDILGHFISDECIVNQKAEVRAGNLYNAYKEWCDDMGHRPVSGTRFGNEMKRRFDSYKTNYVSYLGIGLKVTTDV